MEKAGEPLLREEGRAGLTVAFRRNIDRMKGYQPGEQPQEGGFIKLNTNENPYPPSPRVRRAILSEAKGSLRLYPDPGATPLRRQAALIYGFDLSQVIAGNGSDDLLAMIARAFIGEKDALCCPVPTYTLYDTLVRSGGEDSRHPLPGRLFPPAGHLPRPGERHDGGQPQLPLGDQVPLAVLSRLADCVPGVLVVDEAYADFARTLSLARERENVIVLRTFSKSFSLAGMRIGLGFAHPRIIEGLFKVKDSYNLNRLSIVAGEAALSDIAWMERNAARVRKTREQLVAGLPRPSDAASPRNPTGTCRREGKPAGPADEALRSGRSWCAISTLRGWPTACASRSAPMTRSMRC